MEKFLKVKLGIYKTYALPLVLFSSSFKSMQFWTLSF